MASTLDLPGGLLEAPMPLPPHPSYSLPSWARSELSGWSWPSLDTFRSVSPSLRWVEPG